MTSGCQMIKEIKQTIAGLLVIIVAAGIVFGSLYYLSNHPAVFLAIIVIVLVGWIGWLAHEIGHDFLG